MLYILLCKVKVGESMRTKVEVKQVKSVRELIKSVRLKPKQELKVREIVISTLRND